MRPGAITQRKKVRRVSCQLIWQIPLVVLAFFVGQPVIIHLAMKEIYICLLSSTPYLSTNQSINQSTGRSVGFAHNAKACCVFTEKLSALVVVSFVVAVRHHTICWLYLAYGFPCMDCFYRSDGALDNILGGSIVTTVNPMVRNEFHKWQPPYCTCTVL